MSEGKKATDILLRNAFQPPTFIEMLLKRICNNIVSHRSLPLIVIQKSVSSPKAMAVTLSTVSSFL